jgi:adenosylhomocysteinase
MRTLKAGGAGVVLCASNPPSTQDDVAAASILTDAPSRQGRGQRTYYSHLEAAIDHRPHITMDDSADVIGTPLARRERLGDVIAGTEETTTGVIRLKALEADGEARVPVVAVNGPHQELFDNRYDGPVDPRRDHRATNVLPRARLRRRRYGWWTRRRHAREGHGRARDRDRGRSDAGIEAVMDGFR